MPHTFRWVRTDVRKVTDRVPIRFERDANPDGQESPLQLWHIDTLRGPHYPTPRLNNSTRESKRLKVGSDVSPGLAGKNGVKE
jgi:hypothetical protein